MKPVVLYIDDEPHNLVVLEAALPETWDIHTFDSPLKALEFATTSEIWVVISDQRMPQMAGVKLLEIIKKTNPNTKRILATGYSDEDLIVESVRTAQVHDYIRKPWDVDDLEHRITKMVEAYQLESELRKQTEALEKKNSELKSALDALQIAVTKTESLSKELEAWAPPFILSTIGDEGESFPKKVELAVITFDIIDSSKLHDSVVEGKPVRKHIIEAFSQIVITNGGYRESTSGDGAYAHFGLLKNTTSAPPECALAVASEFRTFLRNFSSKNGLTVECGIALHIAKECIVDIHTIQIMTPAGLITQKSFDSASADIDLVHRIEKMAHNFPGTNILMSQEFIDSCRIAPYGVTDLGFHNFKGQSKISHVYAKLSDQITSDLMTSIKALKSAA